MIAYLNNECLSAHIYLLFKLSCHCLRRCVPRLPLREHVLRAQEGKPASTYLPVSPLSQSCGLSGGTLCGALTFSWYPVRYPDLRLVSCAVPWSSVDIPCQHIEVPRVTSHRRNSPGIILPESPHDSLSKELTHTPWTASACSLWLGIHCSWILDLCSPGQSQLTRFN